MNEHENQAVATENLQRYLRQLSFWEAITPPPIDGIFDDATERSLSDYQRVRGLPVTGMADQETWERLYADYRASLARHSPPRQISVFYLEPEGYVIGEGSVGFAVYALQYMLSELRHSYIGLENVTPTGVYDQATADAVRLFQRESRLPDEGGVGMMTWNELADRYNTLFASTRDE